MATSPSATKQSTPKPVNIYQCRVISRHQNSLVKLSKIKKAVVTTLLVNWSTKVNEPPECASLLLGVQQ
jgi:hypothetical protein